MNKINKLDSDINKLLKKIASVKEVDLKKYLADDKYMKKYLGKKN